MKHLKKQIDFAKLMSKSKTINNIASVISVIDDLLRFDFKALKLNFTNREGFRLISAALNELGVLKVIFKNDNEVSYEDIIKYDVDVDLILNNLNNPKSIEYINSDAKLKNKIEELDYLIKYLEDYKEWKDNLNWRQN